MSKMTNEEAIRWLSNETSAYTIRRYKETHGEKAAFRKVQEAINVAVAALKRDDIRRGKMTECCGNCEYHSPNNGDFICVNKESEYYADYTDFEHKCEEYEQK